MKAFLYNHRQSPRKVRLVASLISGKSVPDAINHLQFIDKKVAETISKLLLSAVSNAKNLGHAKESLMVKEVRVDACAVLKRSMPRARGSAFPIKKRTSQIILTLEEGKAKAKK